VGDRDNLGKLNQKTADNSNVYQEVPNAIRSGAWSSPAYFNGTVYYAGQSDTLKAFPITQGKLATTPSSKSAAVFPYPGSTPSVSANGTQDAIVWALESPSGGEGVLHAYDATSLSNELYNSNQAANGRDGFTGNKFITPVIVNGKVFVGTPTGVVEFGLLP
jgi:outer membrane protein assembly factor BamB